MILAILCILFILASVYSVLYTKAKINQLETQLLSAAQAAAERVAGHMDPDYVYFNSREERGYLAFAAKSSESMVWLVNSQGELIYYSALPSQSRQKLTERDGQLFLPGQILNRSTVTSKGRSSLGDFHELLPEDQEWLTVSYPLSGTYGYGGEVLLHYSLGVSRYSFIAQETSLWISFVVAFAFAVLIIILLSRNITRPISKIVKAAEDVYHGKLSSRVTLKGEDPLYIHESTDYKEDDIMILVRTMNTMISKWEKQENERDDFMSSISHDLRTPLTSIKGFLGAMLDGTVPAEKYDHYLNIVYTEVERLQKLIASLFASTTLEKQKELQLTSFDIVQLAEEVISSIDSIVSQKSIKIDLDEKLGNNRSVIGDRDAIQRVLYNILSNAVKFTPEGGLIKVDIKAKNDQTLTISIGDNGIGIAKEDRENIFNRFYKVNKSRNSEGSGMGLYIARTLLALHGQNIYVGDSELGGARFSFTLSRTRAHKI